MDFRKKLGSGFLKNVVTLVSATAAAQFISIFSAPVLTRIYMPADYGILGIFMSVSALAGILSNLQYNQAIILPKEEESANNLMYLSLFLNIGVFIVSAVAIFLLNFAIANLLKAPEAAPWLLLVPVAILTSGIIATFTVWNNRHKRYKRISISRILMTVVTIGTSIFFGLKFDGPLGLITGYLVGQVLCIIYLVGSTLYDDRLMLTPLSGAIIKQEMIRYRDFPKFTMPSEFINRFTNQMPVYLLSIFSGTAAVGLYNMCTRILAMPVTLIAQAVAEVFKQRASEDYATLGNCRHIFVKTFKNLFALSLLPFIILIIIAPALFAFAFGEPWREAGVYTQLLGIMYLFKFIVSPLSYVYYIAGRQKEDFVLHIWMLFSTFAVFWIANHFWGTTNAMIFLFGLNYTSIYIIYLIRSYKFAKGDETIPEAKPLLEKVESTTI